MPGAVGVLLAAGVATRFGGNKLLHRLDDGRTLAEAAAQRLLEALPLSIAVIRPGDDVLQGLLHQAGMRVVVCPLAGRGMGHSLACGVAAAALADAWVIALADMPYIRCDTLHRVVQGLRTGAAIVAPYYAGRRGHPVAFGRGLLGGLLNLEGDVGARQLVQRQLDKVYRLEVDDPGILQDVDTPADLDRSPLSVVQV
jgi:molybdenum cofactor cytidylyltransferase